jgi:2-keto-4-pentenoate hydratase/2-oxohepta-3-ene-1,7-dioic acid hydratase in catechol pathway
MKSATLRGTNDRIPVGKVICIGQNYAEHAKEIKFEIPKAPVFFLKPSSAIIFQGEQIVLPEISKEVHHEIELTVLIGQRCKNISRETALGQVSGYGIGLDMTMRDVQLEAKKKGLPWTLAKGFDTAAPLSEFVPAEAIGDPGSLNIELKINGRVQQSTGTGKMIFPVQTLISYISQFITLEQGDVIFTGTPAGVSPVKHGDMLEGVLLDSTGTVLTSLSVDVK